MNKKLLVPIVLTAILACSESPTQPNNAKQMAVRVGGPAPLYLAPNRLVGTFPGRYIVVMNDNVGDAVGVSRELGRSQGFNAIVAWNKGLRFFAAKLSPAIVQAIRLDPRVKYVEEDQKLHLLDTYPNPPSWGLDRIDQRNLPLNNTYQDYLGGNTTLVTAHAYIIDTGIRYTHVEFEGRAVPAFDFDSVNSPRGTPNFAADCNGHGTHVAGTVGGRTFGVAKRAMLYGVRVLDCNGSDPSTPYASQVISGVNWITANALHPAVANMSLGGPASQALDDAVRASISSGVTYVIAGGNDSGGDACSVSPARVSEAITVGSTAPNDHRSGFSNIGSCIDLFAPGSAIVSAWNGSDTDAKVDSGTSMAAPHVTGVVANYLAWTPNPSPDIVQRDIISFTTSGAVIDPGTGSPNRLLYSITPFIILMTGPINIPCGGSGTYQMEGAGGVGPYSGFQGYLSHTYGDMYKTFTGVTFIENAPVDGSTQNMLVVGDATDARGAAGEIDYATFMCEYF